MGPNTLGLQDQGFLIRFLHYNYISILIIRNSKE